MHVTREPLRREIEARMHGGHRTLSTGGRERGDRGEWGEWDKRGERGERHNRTIAHTNPGQAVRKLGGGGKGSGKGGGNGGGGKGSGRGGGNGGGTGGGTAAGNGTHGGIGIGIGGGGGGGDLSTRPIFYLKLHKAGSTTVTFALLLRCVLHVILGLKKQNTVICDV